MTGIAGGGKKTRVRGDAPAAPVGMTRVAARWKGREGLGDECGAVRGGGSWRGKICA